MRRIVLTPVIEGDLNAEKFRNLGHGDKFNHSRVCETVERQTGEDKQQDFLNAQFPPVVQREEIISLNPCLSA